MHGEIVFLWKDGNSFTEHCPALFQAPEGYYVQHKRVTDPDVRARLRELSAANHSPLGEDEDYGFVPANVLDRMREHVPSDHQ